MNRFPSAGTEALSGSALSLLLADPSPCMRLLVLRELLDFEEEDGEVQELLVLREQDPLAAGLFNRQRSDGFWEADGHLWQGSPTRATTLALMRLGYLGFDSGHPSVRRGAEALFTLQQKNGAWPLNRGDGESEGYAMIPLQTAFPLRALAMCGFSLDPRAERAYDWLVARRLEDGAWPTGIAGGTEASGVHGFVGGYRRLPHSRWGCRSNTTGALLCLAHHPARKRSPEARRALDLLLGRETRELGNVGLEISRLIGAEPTRGFFTFFARFDPALVLDLCWRTGATTADARIADLSAFIRNVLESSVIWPYQAQPQASRWVTFDLLRSLSRLRSEGDLADAATQKGDRTRGEETMAADMETWAGTEPRTPFQPYPPKRRRF